MTSWAALFSVNAENLPLDGKGLFAMGTRIACCGEGLIDMIPVKGEAGQGTYEPCAGGAVFNSAVTLGRLGAEVEFVTGLSSDLFGRQLRATLAASHVGSAFCMLSDRPTTLAFVELHNGHARYHFYDENSAGRMVAKGDLPYLPEDIGVLFFGGISLCVDPSGSAYEALCLREADTRLIMLDPNIRQSFVRDEEAYRTRLQRMMSVSDIVKVSDEDLDWIFSGSEPLSDKMTKLQSLGPKLVLVTKGSDGALGMLSDGEIVSVPSEEANVIDTVGAGDSFNGGFLAHLSERNLLSKQAIEVMSAFVLREALSFAAKVAAITVSRKGANPPWRKEVA